MKPFEPRALRPADAAEAAYVIRSAFADQGVATDPPSSALRETAEIVAEKLAAGGGAGLEYEGRLIGLLLWAPQNDALYLARLAVTPPWRGRGLAARLIDAGEAEAHRRGCRSLRVQVRLELPFNRRLFARRGFVQVGVRAHPGFAEPTIAVLERPLV